jgi:hypothetical protein
MAVPPGAAIRPTLNMIIISEPSAEATQPVRTGRYLSVGCRGSAAHSDTPSHADAWLISVHTEERNQSKINSLMPLAGLASGWLHDWPG